MKIVHNAEDHLIIEDRPWLTGLLLIGMFLAFLGGGIFQLLEGEIGGGLALIGVGGGLALLFLFIVLRRTRFTFDRPSGQITKTVRSLSGLSRTHFALMRLDRAVVEASVDSDGTTYRVGLALNGPAETIPFTTYYSSGRKSHADMAETVNTWIGAHP